MNYLDISLIVVIIAEAFCIFYVSRKAKNERLMRVKAEMHAFFEKGKLVNIDFVVIPAIEDLLEEKIFLTKVVKHEDGKT